MAQKKMGHPPSGDKLMKDRILVLVDEEIKQKLEKCKEIMQTTTSDIARKGIDNMYENLNKK